MASLLAFLVAASWTFAGMFEAADASTGLAEEPVVQIDAAGSVRTAHAGTNAHNALQVADDSSDRLMRQEVQRHIQEAPEKEEAGLDMLDGSNIQVAGKLMRTIKGLSLSAASLLKAEMAESAESLLQTTPAGNNSKFADDVLSNLLRGNDKKKIQERLWNAINKMDVQKVLEDDIVKIEDDADGNYKALKANLLILHECATMAECPATNCCTPKNPEQTRYKDARNAAYEAYHNIQHDTDLAKQTYLDLLSTVAEGKHKDYYPPSHPLYVPTTTEEEHDEEEDTTIHPNATEEKEPAPPVEEGSMLMIAICVVTAIVIFSVGYLLHKTSQLEHGAKGGHGHGGEENWGGEGEYGAGNYGNY